MTRQRFLLCLVFLELSFASCGCGPATGPALTIDSEYQSPGEESFSARVLVWVGGDGRVSRLETEYYNGRTETTTHDTVTVTWKPGSVSWTNAAGNVRGSATWTDAVVSWAESSHNETFTPKDWSEGGEIRYDPGRPQGFSDGRWDYVWTSTGGYNQWPRGSRDPRPGDGYTTVNRRLIFWVNGHESDMVEFQSPPGPIHGQYLSAPLEEWVPTGPVSARGSLWHPEVATRILHFVLVRQQLAFPFWAGAIFENPSTR